MRGDTLRQDGCTALIWAAKDGHGECVRLLVDSGADTRASENVRGMRGK
jgi:hypothetical protein